MNPSTTLQNIRDVGLDVHAETIAVAPADSSGSLRPYGTVPAHSQSVDKLVQEDTEALHLYEVGPTGFWLCRHLCGRGIHRDVIAPSLPSQKTSNRVKSVCHG